MMNHVDHAEIKMGQILTMIISATALTLQNQIPLIILGGIFLLSGTVRVISPFSLLYRWVIHPLGIIKSDYRLDNIQPHKFGQLVGVITVMLALGLMHFGFTFAGWSIVVVLILLTATSYAGWCVGCFMYYQLNRLGLGGFFKHEPTDKTVIIGARPRKNNTHS
ncbi:MAG: DUF4395 domain-containing protein [Gammaproteobacteria bacterium]|nr:DUF4395 domain-containing protein [Gammaproteobacteria bacterium]